MAIAVSGIVFLLCSVLYERYHLQARLGIDDDVCWLTLLAGPLCMFVFHRQYHSARWLSWMCAAIGTVGLAGAAVTFGWADAAARTHVPTGPLSGIGYAVTQLLSLYVAGVALAASLGGMLGIVARRMDRATEQQHETEGAARRR
jgi:hypothetical protein